jgi:anaerobic magnesium-protoporphyrin IX monomethyl ester cyclase
MFYDDELNVSKSFVELMNGFADLQSRFGTECRLRGFAKSELFTQAQAAVMVCAGFRWLFCGFKAANERILQNIDKRQRSPTTIAASRSPRRRVSKSKH